jgi:hypothetical protein
MTDIGKMLSEAQKQAEADKQKKIEKERVELERLLNAHDLQFVEVCNLLNFLSDYPKTYKLMISMLQHHGKRAMVFGDGE